MMHKAIRIICVSVLVGGAAGLAVLVGFAPLMLSIRGEIDWSTLLAMSWIGFVAGFVGNALGMVLFRP